MGAERAHSSAKAVESSRGPGRRSPALQQVMPYILSRYRCSRTWDPKMLLCLYGGSGWLACFASPEWEGRIVSLTRFVQETIHHFCVLQQFVVVQSTQIMRSPAIRPWLLLSPESPPVVMPHSPHVHPSFLTFEMTCKMTCYCLARHWISPYVPASNVMYMHLGSMATAPDDVLPSVLTIAKLPVSGSCASIFAGTLYSNSFTTEPVGCTAVPTAHFG